MAHDPADGPILVFILLACWAALGVSAAVAWAGAVARLAFGWRWVGTATAVTGLLLGGVALLADLVFAYEMYGYIAERDRNFRVVWFAAGLGAAITLANLAALAVTVRPPRRDKAAAEPGAAADRGRMFVSGTS